MFEATTYKERRWQLKKLMKSGLVILPGNNHVPFNYPSNEYKFRQDSSFLYYFGLDKEGLVGIIDIDNDKEIIFGNDLTVDDMVWTGPVPKLEERVKKVGLSESGTLAELDKFISEAVSKKRDIHFLPQYHFDSIHLLERLLGINHNFINKYASEDLIKAVVAQRSIKSDEEVAEIEKALDISYAMNSLAMQMTKPGIIEREVSGAIEGMALSMGEGISFPIIFSVHGETLHNHYHGNEMKDGDIAVLDSGAESLLHYASDITRTIPVSGKFTDKQKDIYSIVLKAQMDAINAIKPNVTYRSIHLLAAQRIVEGLSNLGIMKGDINDAVENGAHALFFPHGLGHMMGLDVHDMEGLGENFVGYSEEIQRSKKLGVSSLRFGKTLEPGFVLTVEPGIYFIPQLIEQWESENKLKDFINYDKVKEYLNFGGIRIEDDVYVDHTGNRVLGKPIPKEIVDVEKACS